MQDILDRRHLQRDAKDLARHRPGHKREVTRVHLNLHAELGVSRADIEAVLEVFDPKTRGEKALGELEVFCGNDDIEIPADQRLYIRVCIDDAESNEVIVQERKERFPESGPIVDHSGPQRGRVQATPPASPAA